MCYKMYWVDQHMCVNCKTALNSFYSGWLTRAAQRVKGTGNNGIDFWTFEPLSLWKYISVSQTVEQMRFQNSSMISLLEQHSVVQQTEWNYRFFLKNLILSDMFLIGLQSNFRELNSQELKLSIHNLIMLSKRKNKWFWLRKKTKFVVFFFNMLFFLSN